MKRKRFLCAALALCLVAILLPLPLAQAAPSVTVDVSSSVSELPTTGGNANFTIKVSSSEDITITNIAFGSSYNSPTSAHVTGGSSYSYPLTYTVDSSEVGKSLSCTVTYEYADGTGTATGSITISPKQGTAAIAISVSTKVTHAQPGDYVEFTYVLQNTGDCDLTGIAIKDSGIFSGSIEIPQTLRPKGTYTTTKRVSMEDKDLVSNATVTAQSESGTVTASATEKTIYSSTAKLTASAVASKTSVTSDEDIEFTITLKNTGNVTVENVSVLTETDEVIESGISLNVNETKEIKYTSTVAETKSVFFKVKYLSGGETVEESTAGVPITVTGGFGFTLTVVATRVPAEGETEVPEDLTFPATYAFDITVETTGATTLKNLIISEATLGTIDTIAEFPPGTQTVSCTKEIAQAGTFTFTATAVDDKGVTHTASSDPVGIGVDAEGNPPADQGGDGMGTLLTVLLIIGGLVILAAIGLGVVVLLDKKKRAQQAAARSRRKNDDFETAAAGPRTRGGRPEGDVRPRRFDPTQEQPSRRRGILGAESERDSEEDAEMFPVRPRRPRSTTPQQAEEQLKSARDGASTAEDDIRVYRPARRPYERGSRMGDGMAERLRTPASTEQVPPSAIPVADAMEELPGIAAAAALMGTQEDVSSAKMATSEKAPEKAEVSRRITPSVDDIASPDVADEPKEHANEGDLEELQKHFTHERTFRSEESMRPRRRTEEGEGDLRPRRRMEDGESDSRPRRRMEDGEGDLRPRRRPEQDDEIRRFSRTRAPQDAQADRAKPAAEVSGHTRLHMPRVESGNDIDDLFGGPYEEESHRPARRPLFGRKASNGTDEMEDAPRARRKPDRNRYEDEEPINRRQGNDRRRSFASEEDERPRKSRQTERGFFVFDEEDEPQPKKRGGLFSRGKRQEEDDFERPSSQREQRTQRRPRERNRMDDWDD